MISHLFLLLLSLLPSLLSFFLSVLFLLFSLFLVPWCVLTQKRQSRSGVTTQKTFRSNCTCCPMGDPRRSFECLHGLKRSHNVKVWLLPSLRHVWLVLSFQQLWLFLLTLFSWSFLSSLTFLFGLVSSFFFPLPCLFSSLFLSFLFFFQHSQSVDMLGMPGYAAGRGP